MLLYLSTKQRLFHQSQSQGFEMKKNSLGEVTTISLTFYNKDTYKDPVKFVNAKSARSILIGRKRFTVGVGQRNIKIVPIAKPRIWSCLGGLRLTFGKEFSKETIPLRRQLLGQFSHLQRVFSSRLGLWKRDSMAHLKQRKLLWYLRQTLHRVLEGDHRVCLC